MTAPCARDVWIVVLTWNGRSDTLELLDTLVAEPATVLVVDNGSHDGTVAAVRVRHPSVRILETGANLGYAGGNNAGVAFAAHAGARWIGVLNNDTTVRAGFLAPLLDELRKRPWAAVSPDIAGGDDGRPGSWFRGGRLDRATGSPVHLLDHEQPATVAGPFTTGLLTGCCIVASADVWAGVGPFDERMFLVFEDSDWSMRARRLGVDLRVVPASRITHKVSRSFTGGAALLGTYYFARNGATFAARHLGVRGVLRFSLRRVARPAAGSVRREHSVAEPVMAALGLTAAATRRSGRAGRPARTAADHFARARRR